MKHVRSIRQKRWIAKRLVADLNAGLTLKHAVRREGIPYTSMIDIFKGFVKVTFIERYPVTDQPDLFMDVDPETPPISSLRAVSRCLPTPDKK